MPRAERPPIPARTGRRVIEILPDGPSIIREFAPVTGAQIRRESLNDLSRDRVDPENGLRLTEID